MTISAIAAYSTNRAIGVKNKLPWHLPADMKYFMRTTKGHHVLMGRKTYESMGQPLKNRTNIVLTSDLDYSAPGIQVVQSIQEGIELARNNGEEELFIIGGEQVYRQSLPLLDKMYLTEIDLYIPHADAFYPTFLTDQWELIDEQAFDADDRNPYAYTFRVYKKKPDS